MAITQAVANSFKQQLLEGKHDFQFTGGDVFKLALYVSTATLNSATTAYTTTGNQVPDSGQYTARWWKISKTKSKYFSCIRCCNCRHSADLSFTGVTIDS
jgi:hypothetical protein